METERLVIDRLRRSDKEDYFKNISHDKKVLETFICKYAETLEEFDFEPYLGRDELFAIRLKETGRLIGIILYFDGDGDSCEIGYGLGSAYWNKGYATEAVARFIRFCFEEKGFRTVCASFFTGNDASRRVMEKCGMTFERFSPKELTYLGVERDLTYYAISREDGGKVFDDGRFTLGESAGEAYLIADGKRYALSCHPFEPCLYIKDESGALTVVRNAFDPQAALAAFARGETVESITGREYDALDFCEAVEYAAGRGEITIDDAERVFGDRAKKKPSRAETANDLAEEYPFGGDGGIDLAGLAAEFPAVCDKYPDSEVDHVIVKDDLPYAGFASHRRALGAACRELFDDDGDGKWEYDAAKARARKLGSAALFAAGGEGGELTYRGAFLSPPYGNAYADEDFDDLAAALFPNGSDCLEVFEWTTDWSDYFDGGREWWGALCLTVYDRSLDRFVVIIASATD